MKRSTALFMSRFTWTLFMRTLFTSTAYCPDPRPPRSRECPSSAPGMADRIRNGSASVRRFPPGPSTKGPHPVAIVVHGGCWVAKLGNMHDGAVVLDNMRPVAAALTEEAGIATWNIEYRRLGNAGGGWPGTFQDVAHAADFLRTLAKGNDLDLTRVVAIGHSAGGHLVMWLAARPKLPKSSELYMSNPLPLHGVVDLDGPTDLKATISVQQPICGSPVITNLLGGSPDEQPERYRAASPIELLPLGGTSGILCWPNVCGASDAGPKQPPSRLAMCCKRPCSPTPATSCSSIWQLEVWPQVIAAVRRLLPKSN